MTIGRAPNRKEQCCVNPWYCASAVGARLSALVLGLLRSSASLWARLPLSLPEGPPCLVFGEILGSRISCRGFVQVFLTSLYSFLTSLILLNFLIFNFSFFISPSSG
jgi:hypothetical protein